MLEHRALAVVPVRHRRILRSMPKPEEMEFVEPVAERVASTWLTMTQRTRFPGRDIYWEICVRSPWVERIVKELQLSRARTAVKHTALSREHRLRHNCYFTSASNTSTAVSEMIVKHVVSLGKSK